MFDPDFEFVFVFDFGERSEMVDELLWERG
jgi:hypothetical protein